MQSTAYRPAPPAAHRAPATPGGLLVTLSRLPVAMLHWLADVQAWSQEREHLTRLSDHQLQDIGLSRSDVEHLARQLLRPRGH